MTTELSTFLDTVKKPELHIHFRGCLNANLFCNMLLQRRKEDHDQDLLSHLSQQIREYILSCHRCQAFLAALAKIPYHVSSLEELKQEDRKYLQQLCRNLWHYNKPRDFFSTYLLTGALGKQAKHYFPLADHFASYLKKQNIVYAELIFSVGEYLDMGMSIDEIKILLAYIHNQVQAVGSQVYYIFDLVRNFPIDVSIKRLEMLLEHNIDHFVAITLGGDETIHETGDFKKLFDIAAHAGLSLSCHAGEFADHTSVEQAVHILGAKRIGHGVQAIHSQKTLEILKDQSITVEVCPTSNQHTGIWKNIQTHPARTFFEMGIPISFASDDPGLFTTSLHQELSIAHTVLGFSIEELKTTLDYGFQSTFQKHTISRETI